MIITLDTQALNAIVFGRLKTDIEGASVRAALGDGADSIIPATALNVDSLPARPFLALRIGPVPVINNAVYAPSFTWWIYDDPQRGTWRIAGLVRLIGLAYRARLLDSPPGGAINSVDSSVGEVRPDPALGGLLALPYQLIPYA